MFPAFLQFQSSPVQASTLSPLGFDEKGHWTVSMGPEYHPYQFSTDPETLHTTSLAMDQKINPLMGSIARLTGVSFLLGATLLVFIAFGIGFVVRRPSNPASDPFRGTMVTHKVLNLCRQQQTVTSELAKDPKQCASSIFKDLYNSNHHVLHSHKQDSPKSTPEEDEKFDQHDALEKARTCGRWGSAEPSELFLRVSIVLPKLNSPGRNEY